MPTFPAARPLTRGLILAGLAVAVVACKNLTAIDPSFQNITASDTVYALNGAAPNSPNAVKFFDGIVARADQGFGFDLAFDLDGAGNPILIPSKALATNFSSPYSVGLQKATGAFEAVLEAPKDGYRADTAMAIGVGQTVVVESRDIYTACTYAIKGQSYFSKIVVTEVDTALRRMVFTMTVNRNCGFHSFAPGFPRD